MTFFKIDPPVFHESLSHFLTVKGKEVGEGEFIDEIFQLYVEAAQKELGDNWVKVLDVAFLGGSNRDFFSRLSQGEVLARYMHTVFSSVVNQMSFSSILLPPKIREGVLDHLIQDLMSNSREDGDSGSFLHPLSFFKIYHGHGHHGQGQGFESRQGTSYDWHTMGLMPFLETHFPWAFNLCPVEAFDFDRGRR